VRGSPPGPSLSRLFLVTAFVAGSSCARGEPPGAGISPASNSVAAAPSSVASIASVAAPPSSAPPEGSSAASAAGSATQHPADDPDNKTEPPSRGPELEQSGRSLFEAIVTDDPEKARTFFFPREPFTPLKDVAEPDRYWRNLYRAYEHDIHQLHRKRRDWSGATFESFEIGSRPTWVRPGDEYNKIGYFRTFGALLRYRFEGKPYSIKVHTLISWQGRWTITHLLPFKKK